MRMKQLPLMAVLAIMSLVLVGCANHLRDTENVSQEDSKTVLNEKYDLKLTPETIRDSSYHVEIEKLESVEVKKYQVSTVKSIVTPYQGWREVYEIQPASGFFPSPSARICSSSAPSASCPMTSRGTSRTSPSPA